MALNPTPNGEPLHQRTVDAVEYPPAAIVPTDPRTAMAWAVGEVLGAAVFYRPGDPDVQFQLDAVYDQWPTPNVALNLPCASVIDDQDTEFQAHSTVPTILEETYEQFCPGTVLWKDSRAATTFQVDIWAQHDQTVSAVMARLPAIFNPSEVRAGILVEVPQYYCQTTRLTLVSYQPINTAAAVFENERRIMARVRAEIDSVHLRHVNPLTINVTSDVRAADDGQETGETQ